MEYLQKGTECHQKGMTDCLAVNPYLMSPAGLQSEFYQGGAVKTLKYRVVCHGRITVRRNVPKHNASGFLAMGRSIVPLSFSNTLCTMPMYSLMKVLSFIWRMRNSWQYGFFANMMMPEVSLSSLITGRIFFTIPFF